MHDIVGSGRDETITSGKYHLRDMLCLIPEISRKLSS